MKRFIIILTAVLLIGTLGTASDLSSKDSSKRLEAVKKAAKKTSYRYFKELKNLALKDKSPKIRHYAVKALARLRSFHSRKVLEKVFKDDKNNKVAMLSGLLIYDFPKYVGTRFLEYCASGYAKGYTLRMRKMALKILGKKLGSRIKLLINLVLKDSKYELRLAAAKMLVKTAHKDNIRHMIYVLRTGRTPTIKYYIVKAMLKLKSKHFLRPAINAYKRTKNKKLKKKLYKLICILDKDKAKKLK
ncbi:MAG: hypothetical protein KAR07_01045 [Spirochaetes bacterium]|nr:hypothetical protein [Spirochaetota bacterium]